MLVFLVVLALAFDFMNGLHDAANSIATVVSTGVLRPHHAVAFAAFFNFVAIFVFHLKVAATVGKGIVDPVVIDHYVIFGALVGAISWNAITWFFGLPSSSSHALIGGLIGAAVAKVGFALAGRLGHRQDRALHLHLADPGLRLRRPAAGRWCRGSSGARAPSRIDRWFRRLQLVSAAAYSLGHGGNDAQKTIGIIWVLLIAANVRGREGARPRRG